MLYAKELVAAANDNEGDCMPSNHYAIQSMQQEELSPPSYSSDQVVTVDESSHDQALFLLWTSHTVSLTYKSVIILHNKLY